MSLPAVEILSREEWEQRRPDRGAATLSLVNASLASEDLMSGKGWGLFRRLVMDDVSDKQLSWLRRWAWGACTTQERHETGIRWVRKLPGRPVVAPTPWAASQVVAFAVASRRFDRVVVHCEYGKSRSAIAGRAIVACWTGRQAEPSDLDPQGRNPRWARLLSTALATAEPRALRSK